MHEDEGLRGGNNSFSHEVAPLTCGYLVCADIDWLPVLCREFGIFKINIWKNKAFKALGEEA
jgi:hypothetical protein